MENAGELLKGLVHEAGKRIEPKEGDYYGDDGLLRCGMCGEPKEYLLRDVRIVPVVCACGLAERAQRDAENRRAAEAKNVAELAAYSITDSRFRQATFDAFKAQSDDDRRVLEICRRYVEHFDEMYATNTGLIFYGAPGTGKTFAADCIANALMEKRVPVLVTSIIRLTNGLYDGDMNELLRKMNTARLLVLDDFGAERGTDFRAEQIFSVIDARYAANKPMIITTNLTDFKDADIRRQRVYDRIFEVCKPVKMNGESRRREEGAKRRAAAKALLEGV